MHNDRYVFRGKRKDDGEWVQGYFYKIWDECYILWGMTNGIPNMTKVDPETIGRCTGLKDKRGTLIFEGDIIKGKNIQGIVSWMPEHCAYMVKTLIDGCVTGYEYLTSGDGKTLDVFVIGNIYEKGDEK